MLSAVIFNFLHITGEKELADSHWEPKHRLCDQLRKHAGSYVAPKSNVTFHIQKVPLLGTVLRYYLAKYILNMNILKTIDIDFL